MLEDRDGSGFLSQKDFVRVMNMSPGYRAAASLGSGGPSSRIASRTQSKQSKVASVADSDFGSLRAWKTEAERAAQRFRLLERLFKHLDAEGVGELEYKYLVVTLSLASAGSVSDKAKFAFLLFD